jgi:hypothetical protein
MQSSISAGGIRPDVISQQDAREGNYAFDKPKITGLRRWPIWRD